jgi:YidC/Oxa1 family membrane protein insertase
VKEPIILTSQNLEVVLTNKGAGVERLTLLHHPKGDDTVPILKPFDPRWPHLAVRDMGGPDAIESLPWEVVEQTPVKVEFRYRLRNGIQITKIIAIEEGRHTLQMTLWLDNKGPKQEGKDEPATQNVQLELLAFNGLDLDSTYRYEQYLMGVWRYDHQLRLKGVSEIEKGEEKLAAALALAPGAPRDAAIKEIEEKYFTVGGGLKEWFGVKNRFFTALLLPDSAALDTMDHYNFRDLPPQVRSAQENRHNIVASAVTTVMPIGGGRKVLQFTAYAGPLEKEVLHEIPGADELGGYTGGCIFGFVVKPAAAVILELLHFTSKLLHNMGLGIIMTTLFIRLCLFPLSLKSQRNAMQMQALAPKIQALKERYKDDQQKYGVEQMRLFKEHGVNPVAGCLPLFIQMPIFVGMYSVFQMSPMLRHAPFVLWITDLSEPDRLLGGNWGFHIPLPILPDINIQALNLLPILMTVTWFLQAYWTPRSPDPQMAQQQKMMMWMPLVFGFSCYGLASGLSLYFLSNSLLSMAEQKIIKRYILKIGPDGKPLVPVTPGDERK